MRVLIARLRFLLCCACWLGTWPATFACQRSPKTEAPKPAPRTTAARPEAVPKVLLTQAPAPTPEAPAASAPQLPRPARDAGAPQRQAYTVAVMGDSLTDYRSGGGKFIRYLEKRCPESQFDNFGKGGDMVNQMRRRLSQMFISGKSYTHVIIYGGVNDLYSDLTAKRTNDRIQTDLTAMYEAAGAGSAAVVALTVSPWGGFKRYFNERRGNNTLALNTWILAQEGGLVDVVIDTHPLLRCGDAHRLCPEYHRPFEDGLHLGKKGHEVLGAVLYERVFHDCL